MPTVKEKIAYLRGLMEGSEFYANDSHAQTIWNRLLDIMDDLADQVESLRVSQEEAEEYLEALDNDLSDVEDEVYGHDEDDEIEFVEMECPNCKEIVYFEEDFLYDDDVEISCPECGTVLYRSGEDDEDEDQQEPDLSAAREEPARDASVNGQSASVRESPVSPERP